MNYRRHRTAAATIALMVLLAIGIAMPVCHLADHDDSPVAHPYACATIITAVFQIAVLMTALSISVVSQPLVLLPFVFPLLKPPRPAALPSTAR